MAKLLSNLNLLKDVRVYLSGPMDFVASRETEKKHGWRTRVGQFLHGMGAVVFDPWSKPDVRGLHDFGREGTDTAEMRSKWTFEQSPKGAAMRAELTGKYWETLHIDLRMVDTADFLIAYCPTNIYSVGTPHEIALARSERKPVLFVSPTITFPTLQKLQEHLKDDAPGAIMLDEFIAESGAKENAWGTPSLWYMPLVGGENFFDGFGFGPYRKEFKWNRTTLDEHEEGRVMKNPLLPFLERLNRRLPKKWDNKLKKHVANDDWLLWDLQKKRRGGLVEEPKS